MAIFTIQTPGGKKLRIEAGDEATALRGAQEWASQNEAPDNAPSPSQGYNDALADASARSQSLAPKPQEPARPDLMGATAATLGGIVNGVPILGPVLQNTSDAIIGAGSVLTGGDYGETVEGLQNRRAQLAEANPIADIAGNVAGGIGSLGAAGATTLGGEVLGMTGKLVPRIANSALSGAALSAGDTVVKGGDVFDAVESGVIGGGLGGAIPIAGAAIKAAVAPAIRGAQSLVRGALAPEMEAARGVGGAITRDAAGPVPLLSEADNAAAQVNEQPLLNIDRGGEVSRQLMRAAANQNPEALSVVEKAAQDRFATQSKRAGNFMSRLMGGNIDDLARRAEIKSTARVQNSEAYRKAYKSPAAQAVFSKPLQELMQSPTIQSAISAVKKTGGDEAALLGMKPVTNPFRQGQDGTWRLVQKADGTTAVPNLEFWDQVQRNVRGQIDAAKPGGEDAMRLSRIRDKLISALDSQVPEFAQARAGAFGFFNAKNALDAGKKAFASPKAIDESLAALRSLSKEDQQDFATGLMAEALDAARATNNRSNMTRIFDNEARKTLMAEALGPERYGKFEQFIRIEDQMDRVRGALGNPTTARQLVQMGLVNELKSTGGQGALGGVAGFAASGGNLSAAATMAILTAAGRHGLRFARSGVDAKVMEQMAKLLASGKPQELELAMTLASQAQVYATALDAIDKGIGTMARGTLQSAVGQ